MRPFTSEEEMTTAFRLVLGARREHHLGAERVDPHAVQRLLHDVAHSHHGRHVPHGVRGTDLLVHQALVQHAPPHQAHPVAVVREVALPADRQVVEDCHVVSLGD